MYRYLKLRPIKKKAPRRLETFLGKHIIKFLCNRYNCFLIIMANDNNETGKVRMNRP